MNIQTIKSSIWCGILISIGGLAYLTIGGPLGALLFSFGLISVINTGNRRLFTGVAGIFHPKEIDDYFSLLIILGMNFVGCGIISVLVSFFLESNQLLDSIIEARYNTPLHIIGIKSIFTGLIMHICVWSAKYKGTYIPVLIGVPLFILCGLPHCVADIFYYFVSEIQNGWSYEWIVPWLVSVGGNFIGCNIPQILKSCPES